MSRTISAGAGAMVTITIMVAALWLWQRSGQPLLSWQRPEVGAWALRCGAAALAGLAQVVLLATVVGRIYQRRLLDDMVRLGVALVSMMALAGAVALGLAAR